MKEVILRQAGGSVSATLPKDMLTPYDPDTERALRIAARAAKKYRNALRELAR